MNNVGSLFETALEHHGVVTLAMAAEAGVHARVLRARAREEGWVQLARGAWLMPGAPDTHRARAMAHVLLLGERAVVSHASAAHLHGLLRQPPRLPVLTVPAERRPSGRPGVRIHRSRTLTRGDVVDVDGLRVTAVGRTLRDRAAGRNWDDVYDEVTDAEQRGLATLDGLVQDAERLRRGPGGAVFGSVVRQRQADRSDSALERDTREAARVAGFHPTAGPFPIRTRSGSLLRLDIAFPEIWFAIECDGFGFHRDRTAFERDRERWILAQQVGWRLSWVTRKRLREDLVGILEEIADAHRTADRSRPAAIPAA